MGSSILWKRFELFLGKNVIVWSPCFAALTNILGRMEFMTYEKILLCYKTARLVDLQCIGDFCIMYGTIHLFFFLDVVAIVWIFFALTFFFLCFKFSCLFRPDMQVFFRVLVIRWLISQSHNILNGCHSVWMVSEST